MTLSELGQKYELHPHVITNSKNDFLEKSRDVFNKPGKKSDKGISQDELYKEIGKLKVENEYLKKT